MFAREERYLNEYVVTRWSMWHLFRRCAALPFVAQPHETGKGTLQNRLALNAFVGRVIQVLTRKIGLEKET